MGSNESLLRSGSLKDELMNRRVWVCLHKYVPFFSGT